ncbi:sodium:solute symporter [Flavisolibacter ginsenosidimutans]|uniref:Sodium:solute symporter n=1 Tax=Flavisolibacter ginsenosidimutans TaxID=661481 RepID=A0A5B8UGT5_9BACT|nr:sodium:solute symporter [Flavisolibacter ginsenosidimutans]QEC55728.1 sodium:solute symporter [Flavisolibacter ginsenosidimutans]
MNAFDWLVIVVVLVGIVLYGLYKSRTSRNLEGYFLSNRNLPWYVVLLSIMGTQASAITFMSGPGQAFSDGMRFLQYYFGLPLAMVVICITFVPLFNRLKVYTAYEFLEKRFDNKTRTLTSFLFLLQRGLSTGISIYMPSIIVSSLFGWDVFWVNLLSGGALIIYTVSGGAKAVAHTQKIQLLLIFSAMAAAAYVVIHSLPQSVTVGDALNISGKAGRTNIITTGFEKGSFDWNDKYNLFSGLIGGFFLSLSYFGTDHSQVGRYLTAQNNRESKLGLLMNGLVKIPMQFGILLLGVLLFAYYQFNSSPITFNEGLLKEVQSSSSKDSLQNLQRRFEVLSQEKQKINAAYVAARHEQNNETKAKLEENLRQLSHSQDSCRTAFANLAKTSVNKKDNGADYVFLTFIKNVLPAGLRGLLLSIIFLASWSSIAAALNSLAASTVVDFHERFKRNGRGETAYRTAKWYTLAWGVFSVLVAEFAHNLGQSLIETVNVLGSLFYGVILGIFLVAFYLKRVSGTAVFVAALFIETFVVLLFFKQNIPALSWLPTISFLWLNAIGAIGVMLVAVLLQTFSQAPKKEK